MTEREKFDYLIKREEHARRYYRPWDDLHGRLVAFSLDMEQYKAAKGFDKDSKRLQPKGQQVTDLIRHKGALLATAPLRFDMRPVRPVSSMDEVELARRTIDAFFSDPRRRVRQSRDRAIIEGLAASRGVLALDWNRETGLPCLRKVDPRHFRVAPGHIDPHHEYTPWVMEEVFYSERDLDAHRANGWDIPKDLPEAGQWRPDGVDGGSSQAARNVGDAASDAREGEVDGRHRAFRFFFRHDPFTPVRGRMPQVVELPREAWEFVDDTTGERRAVDIDLTDPAAVMPTDAAGNPLRIATTNEVELQEASREGRDLCVVVFPADPRKKIAWSGRWLEGARDPDDTMASFPYWHWCAYPHPLRLVGTNDTLLNHTLQILSNSVVRNGWEQLRMAQSILITEPGALLDAEGRQFQFSDRPWDLAYARDRLSLESTKVFQGPGMNSALPAFDEMVSRRWAFRGTGDIAMPDDRSRDVAVGTVKALQSMGDLPTKKHLADIQSEDAMLAQCLLDMMRAYLGVPYLVEWLSDKGESIFVEVQGADLSPMTVMVAANGDEQAMATERTQSINQFMLAVKDLPPQMWYPMAVEARLSATGQRAIQQAAALILQQQQQAAQQAALQQRSQQGAAPTAA